MVREAGRLVQAAGKGASALFSNSRKARFNAKVIRLLELAFWDPTFWEPASLSTPCSAETTAAKFLQQGRSESPNRRMIEQQKAEQGSLTAAQRAARVRERDAAARAFERYLDTPEGRAVDYPDDGKRTVLERRANFYAKYPQHKPRSLKPGRKHQARPETKTAADKEASRDAEEAA